MKEKLLQIDAKDKPSHRKVVKGHEQPLRGGARWSITKGRRGNLGRAMRRPGRPVFTVWRAAWALWAEGSGERRQAGMEGPRAAAPREIPVWKPERLQFLLSFKTQAEQAQGGAHLPHDAW